MPDIMAIDHLGQSNREYGRCPADSLKKKRVQMCPGPVLYHNLLQVTDNFIIIS